MLKIIRNTDSVLDGDGLVLKEKDYLIVKIFGITVYNSYKNIIQDKDIRCTEYVECEVCRNKWLADHPKHVNILECPNCHQMTEL